MKRRQRVYLILVTYIFDEANLFTQDDFIALNGSIRSKKYKNLQVIISFNPMSMENWIYKYFWFDREENPPNTLILKTTYKDNDFLPDTYHDEMLLPVKEINPRLYNILANGLFQTVDELVFNNWKVEEFDIQELIRNNTSLITCIGLDWGFNDPTTVILSLVDTATKTMYICDEIYKKGLTNSEIAALIKEKGWHKNIIVADCANPKDITDLKRMGIDKIRKCSKGKDSIMNGLRKLQEYKIIINKTNCKNVITEFDNYTWQKDKQTGNYIDKPIHTFNHCIDSIRYSIQVIKKKAKILSVSL